METPNEGLEQQAQPTLCVTGCGFFANYGSGGMCSKCFREAQQAEQQRAPAQETAHAAKAAAAQASAIAAAAPQQPAASEQPAAAAEAAAAASPAPVPAMPASPTAAAAGASSAATAEAAAAVQQPAQQEAAAPAAPKTATRCNQCRKKVGLTGFTCKCGLLFCGQHRYAEAHDCSFDYKTTQREKLAAANPVVQAAKVERI